MISDNSQTPHLPQNAVSGSVFHPAISHINCDKNISEETVNAINKMVDCVFSKKEIKESKKFIQKLFKKIKNNEK